MRLQRKASAGYHVGMTLLVVPVSGESADELRAQVDAALAHGAEAIELRVDLMGAISAEDFRLLRRNTPAHVPFILTIRSASEGGAWDGGDDERVGRMIELGPLVEYVDVELAMWRRSANIRQKIELALHRADHISQAGGREEIEFGERRKLILSQHDHTTRPASLHKDFVTMVSEPLCHAPKLAWRARTVRDNFEAIELMRDCPKQPIVICMGDAGIMSRVLARKFGAFASFAALRSDLATAAGQLTIEAFKQIYRWDSIDEQTALYGVIGDPVKHSLSPVAHNAAFAKCGLNAVYLPLPVTPSYEAFKAFMLELQARPWLGFRGFSVTIPHKENALRYLQEIGGNVDPLCERLGAVNTLVLGLDGDLSGFNTDHGAVLACLSELTQSGGRVRTDLSAAVLGAGGVARAVVGALVDLGATVTIYNRTVDKAATLAAEFRCQHAAWESRNQLKADLVVNCTSVGMIPHTDESPVPAAALAGGVIAFDTVYRPLDTRFLREARSAGGRVIDGLSMFMEQARAQFRLWTGESVELETLRESVEAYL